MSFELDEYFSQFEIMNRFRANNYTEIWRLKMLLYVKHSDLPKYVCCKVLDLVGGSRLHEAKIMKKLSKKKLNGMITYYHHILSDKLYIYMEDCFKYKSAFEESLRLRSKLNENFNNRPQEVKNEGFLNKNFERNFFRIVEDLVESLREIHLNNYIHCDIAPKNILISNDKKYKIADFGSAVKKQKCVRECTEIYLDTKNFEKLKNCKDIVAEESMDYYALGKSLYEMLTLDINAIFPQKSHESVPNYITNNIHNKMKLDNIYADIIIDIMKMKYKSCHNHIKFTKINSSQILSQQNSIISKPTTELNKDRVNECSICKISKKSNDKLLNFACKHSFHKNCLYFFRGLYICPVCKRFIGTSALNSVLNPKLMF